MIERIELKNFMVFDDISVDFSPKVNIFIGENGTGKTQLLKAIYGLGAGAQLFKNSADAASTDMVKVSYDDIRKALTQKMLSLFLPLDDKLGKMYHHGAQGKALLSASFSGGHEITTTFSSNSTELVIQSHTNYVDYKSETVFFPTKEMLSFMLGFNSLYEKYELSFDQTYQDMYINLELPKLRPENLHEKAKWAMEELEKLYAGKFVFHGGGKVTFKTKNNEYAINAIAEGFRKAGMLARLFETGAISVSTNGILLWDEPEANLNPKLMELLVQIMLELSRNGQQIIISTHDYVLPKWFDILMDDKKEDSVRFHTLYRNNKTDPINIASTDDYLKVSPNPIDEAFSQLMGQEIINEMGGLGQ